MKKKLLLTLLLMLACFSMAQAEVIHVGYGSATDGPMLRTLYSYYYSEQIYAAEEINAKGTITDIAVYNVADADTRNLDIYLAHTDMYDYSNRNDWFDYDDETNHVFSGMVTFTPGMWTTIHLDKSFQYNGKDNLGLVVIDYTGRPTPPYTGGSKGITRWVSLKSYKTSYEATLYKYEDESDEHYSFYKTQLRLTITKDDSGSGDVVHVGSGLDRGSLPIVTNQGYCLSQQIYTPEEINHSGSMTSLALKTVRDIGASRDIEVYLVETDKKYFGSDPNSDYIIPEESDKVFSGSVTFQAGEWTPITFDRPFEYDCTNNLCLIVNDKTGTTGNYAEWLSYKAPSQTIYARNDVCYDPLAPFRNFYGSNAKCQLQLTFSDGTPGPYTTVDVGCDNNIYTETVLPTHTGHDYSYSQQIYTPEEIGQTGLITQISYFAESCDNTPSRTFDLYMVKTSKSSFSSVSDYLVPTESDKVFSGKLTFPLGEWTTIVLDKPFDYDGTENLCIIMRDNTGGNSYYKASWLVFAGTSGCSLAWHGLDHQYNLANPYEADVISGKKNCIKLSFTESNRKELGSGDATNTYLPTNIYYNYSLTQQIYTKEELWKNPQNVTSIGFFNKGGERKRNLDIYLVSTVKQGFGTYSDWINFTEDDKVFSGEVTFEPEVWTTIPFFKSFKYDGKSNIALIVDDNTGGYQAEAPFLAYEAPRQTLYVYNDNTNFNADGLSGYTGTILNMKNQVRFGDAELDLKPYDLTVTDIDYNKATISWKSAGSKWLMQYKTTSASSWYNANNLTSPTFTLLGLAQETTFDIRVCTIKDDGSYSDYVYTQFTTLQRFPRPTDVEVTDITPTSATLSWTENGIAAKWRIYLNDAQFAITDSNPFLLTDLKQGYRYSVVVQPIIEFDDDDEPYYGNRSVPVTFFTPLANPAPDFTSIVPTPNSATIAWEGKGDSYEVKYRSAASEENVFFRDGFESGNLTEKGWTIIRNGEGTSETNWHVVPGYHHNGAYAVASYSLWTNNQSFDVDNWLITPKIELGEKLEFYIQNGGYAAWLDKYEVLLSLEGNELEDFNIVLQPLRTSYVSWLKDVIDLSAYEGREGYIAIRHKDEKKSLITVDDFRVYTPAKEAGEWQTVETTENTVTIEGLEPNTEYDLEVVSIMEGEDSSSSTESFTTLIANPVPSDIAVETSPTSAHIDWTGYGDAYEVSLRKRVSEGEGTFYDDFESGTLSRNGWTVYTDAATIPEQSEGWYVISTGWSNVVCSNSYYFSSQNQDVDIQADNWLISPQVPLGGKVSFRAWIRLQYPEEFAVLLSTTGKEKADFTEVLRPLSPAGWDGWTTLEFDLSEYEGKVGYIAIRDYCFGKFYMYIDDFTVSYDVASYGETMTINTVETEATITGLEKNTSYECMITSKKSGQYDSHTEPFVFKTRNLVDLALDDNSDNTYILQGNENELANVTINHRLFKKDGTWQGICLPFDVDVENSILKGADVRTLESLTQMDNYILMNCLTPVTEMKAGTPYIIRWKEAGEDIYNPYFEYVTIDLTDRDVCVVDGTEVGVCNRTAGSGSYIIYSAFECNYDEEYIWLMNGTSVLTPITADAGLVVHAFDIMFNVMDIQTDDTVVLLNTGDPIDLIDGISSLKEKEGETEIYNIAGMRLNKMQRGINIVNGRKVLIR